MHRIMQIDEGSNRIVVTTTDIHSPQRIAEALKHAYHGDFEIGYGHDEYTVRVNWQPLTPPGPSRRSRPRQFTQTPLQITTRHMAHSHALTTRVREDVAKLAQFYPHIVSCHVVVEQRDRHQSRGRSFNVRIALSVPGHELVINHDHDEDVYVALRDAFASLTRRLEDVARRQRGDVKRHGAFSEGKTGSVTVDED